MGVSPWKDSFQRVVGYEEKHRVQEIHNTLVKCLEKQVNVNAVTTCFMQALEALDTIKKQKIEDVETPKAMKEIDHSQFSLHCPYASNLMLWIVSDPRAQAALVEREYRKFNQCLNARYGSTETSACYAITQNRVMEIVEAQKQQCGENEGARKLVDAYFKTAFRKILPGF